MGKPPSSEIRADTTEEFVDLTGSRVEREETAAEPGMSPPDSGQVKAEFFNDVRFRFGTLDVPYGEIDMVDNVIWPTNYTSVFGIRNLGVRFDQLDKGTAYLATHTLQKGWSPGNWFFDQGKLSVNEGDSFQIGQSSFRVSDTYQQSKDDAQRNETLWDASVKNRLFLIVCSPDGGSNQIIEAMPL
ncbi:hypothetical protein D9V82_01750 [Corynebacterium macginleyi]|nr:hypothetical protein D9V82_01750 [Corynebacterium macginleyi]